MRKEVWLLDEIEVQVSGFFTTHHTFQTRSGALGEMTCPAFSQQGIYHTPDGRELLMQKTHWLGSAFELVEGGIVRGHADRPGLFRRDLTVQFDGREYSLEPAGFLNQGWILFDVQGNKLLEFQPRGVFRQGAYLTITGAVDADLAAFVYYLVYMRQQEDAAVVAAAAS